MPGNLDLNRECRSPGLAVAGAAIAHSPSSHGWRYVASLAQRAFVDATRLDFVRYSALAVSEMSCVDGLDTDAALLLGAVHDCQALRPSSGPERRRVDVDLTEVGRTISASLLAQRSIQLSMVCRPVVLNAWRSWQICMIVAELLLDAACNARDVRSIGVEFGATAGEVKCVVFDDGRALANRARLRGAMMIEALVSEMGGRVARCADEKGTAAVICVPEVAS